MKNVQIPYDLFMELLHYHLVQKDDYAEDIRRSLEEKLDAMAVSYTHLTLPTT